MSSSRSSRETVELTSAVEIAITILSPGGDCAPGCRPHAGAPPRLVATCAAGTVRRR